LDAVAFTYSILVVAKRTADSDELLEALRELSAARATRFTVLVPTAAAGPEARADAQAALDRALEALRGVGLDCAGHVGHTDPVDAVSDLWDPREYDEIVVSTLPGAASKWLQFDVPHRIARVTGAPVRHVLASDRREPIATQVPRRERSGVLSPLSVLTWGGGGGDRAS
jgi:GABA permease